MSSAWSAVDTTAVTHATRTVIIGFLATENI